jgi:hypothetical protein
MYTDLDIASSTFYNNTAETRTKNIFAGFLNLNITDTYFGADQPSGDDLTQALEKD